MCSCVTSVMYVFLSVKDGTVGICTFLISLENIGLFSCRLQVTECRVKYSVYLCRSPPESIDKEAHSSYSTVNSVSFTQAS